MLKNYIKIAWRNIWNNKGYTFLNIFGLAIGITCAALILLWIDNEMSYNEYFADYEDIYTIKNTQTYGDETFVFEATPGPLAELMRNEIPGIGNVSRSASSESLFSHEEKNIHQTGKYVEPEFFEIFELKFIQGDPSTAFHDLHSIVVTESMARKFFGSGDVLNKTLRLNQGQSYVITAVIEDLPENISPRFRFSWLSPFKNYENANEWLQGWNNAIQTYVKPEANADIVSLNETLYGFIQTKLEDSESHLSLYPMDRWRLYNEFDKNGLEKEGIFKYVRLFGIIAGIILIIACINFMNLATARSEKRAREIGVRKVLGAQRKMLIVQFLSESVLLAFLATLLSIALIYIFLPPFNDLVNKQLILDLSDPLHLGALLMITIISGIFAGSFPSYYLSSFNPVKVIKGIKSKSSSAAFIRKGLVVFQFSISIILIIATVLVYQQINHVKNRDLGYDNEGLVFLPANENIKKNFQAISNELISSGAANELSLSGHTPVNIGSNGGGFQWPGKDPENDVLVSMESVSPSYIKTSGMELISGQDFNPNVEANESQVIINETLAKMIDKENAVGKVITRGDSQATVRGVVKDFVYNNIFGNETSPLILYPSSQDFNHLVINIDPDKRSTAVSAIERVMEKYNPGYPTELIYADEKLEEFMSNENMVGKLAAIFAGLAIIISCLGLFGLAAFTAERRIKEIGIRKVLGASVGRITTLLSVDFMKLVLISCLIAFPLAWWFARNWLENYPYRIDISIWIFVVAGLLAFLIAFFTVSFQALKAALTNPINNLRTE
ncbi:ABC transporter permease [Salegentibacter flavus]|uniref:Duplicated orphan permease n=1 Tax=Salegentibacter flavus TaxID=287099 RepID=A0A1I5ASV3_9FLAO|nr:ABC transporter permease [Salegentibacter flavus]SFN65269.1 duplicated orphan permease [Salegentibacter flavus]